MTIVDTSVVIAVLLPEPASATCRAALLAANEVQSTDLLGIELLNAASNMARRRRQPWSVLNAMLDQATMLPIVRVAHQPLLPAAGGICAVTGCAAYDAMLVALAERAQTPLLTLDARLGRTLAGTPWERWVRVLGVF